MAVVPGNYMDEELYQVGSLIPEGNAAESGNTWQNFLQDPVTRSAMLSMGLQMMTGGWGNGAQQLAAAIGAGAQGAAGTAQAIAAQQKDARDFEADQSNKAADRAERGLDRESRIEAARIGADSRAEVAGIAAASRLEVAQARVAGLLERTRLNINKASQPVILKYRQLAEKELSNDLKALGLTGESRQRAIDARADQMYTDDVLAGRHAAPGGSSAVENGQGRQGASGQSQSPAGGTSPPVAGKTSQTPPSLEQLLNDPKMGARIREDLSTPEGRAYLRARRPDLAPQIDQWESFQPGSIGVP